MAVDDDDDDDDDGLLEMASLGSRPFRNEERVW